LLQKYEITNLCTRGKADSAVARARLQPLLSADRDELNGFLELARTHHVMVRALEVVRVIMQAAGNPQLAEWAESNLTTETTRIAGTFPVVAEICRVLEARGCQVKVIKSLDHLPDIGSDFDLFTDASPDHVIPIVCDCFDARMDARSIGDRLANKWNFIVPGLCESVEIHMGRLGQTGEQVGLAKALASRGTQVRAGGFLFDVPTPEDRIIITALQRMYRHFYFRLCDIVDTAALLDAGAVDFRALQKTAGRGGVWRGVATLLKLVSDYVRRYRGADPPLPGEVISEAAFDGDQLSMGGIFLRIPIVPSAVNLYADEITALVKMWDWRSAARLSTLPCLASAAFLKYRATGNDKGVW
jgi:hypothetical protein